MTAFEISRLAFDDLGVTSWAPAGTFGSNWPVVYVLDDPRPEGPTSRSVYVGETRNAVARLKQHLASPERGPLIDARVVLDPTFNKSVCLDLESFLIRMFAGDGLLRVLNRNDGIVDADYYDRERYTETFEEVFEALRRDGLFRGTRGEIENSDLFKLSPFKALTPDQTIVVGDIVEGLLDDLASGAERTVVVQGEPGTGKTILAVYLLKLVTDIAHFATVEDLDGDSAFADLFTSDNRSTLTGLRVGFVIPQQSLRESVRRVFKKTPGLAPSMVLSQFDVGEAEEDFDLLVVDEAHRLNQRANQPSGVQNKRFRDITERLFGFDDVTKTQLDWIVARSRHRILMLDAEQTVRPADLPRSTVLGLIDRAAAENQHHRLFSQMRVKAGSDYVRWVRELLAPDRSLSAPKPIDLGEYDFRIVDDLAEMRRLVLQKDSEHGLARLVAGYAWECRSRSDPAAYDIEIGDVRLRWNRTQKDWIASAGSVHEVGSIHTVQGYDLNYAGVVIGPDLRYDPVDQRLFVDRSRYFDKKGMENNPTLGLVVDDEALLRFVVNIYAVLLTRGIRGTYVHVVDPALRELLHARVAGLANRPRTETLTGGDP